MSFDYFLHVEAYCGNRIFLKLSRRQHIEQGCLSTVLQSDESNLHIRKKDRLSTSISDLQKRDRSHSMKTAHQEDMAARRCPLSEPCCPVVMSTEDRPLQFPCQPKTNTF